MAAVAAIRHNPVTQTFCRRLRAQGKKAKVAVIAVAHKLLTIANAMVRDWVRVASGCIIGAGALITRDTRPGGVYLAPASEMLPGSSAELSALLEAR